MFSLRLWGSRRLMRGQISWFAIFFGDFTPDFLAKFWVYGFNYNGHHYGASKPYQWHRGWPGMGFTRMSAASGRPTARATISAAPPGG